MIVDLARYEDGRRRPGTPKLKEAYEACGSEDTFVWLGPHEPTNEEFDSVRREFDLHGLAVEDAIKAHQRPKLEIYGDSFFVVLKTVRYVRETASVELGEIQLFIGDGFLTVRHGETKLHDVRLRMEKRPDLLCYGPAAALHAIIDRVVDDYERVIGALDRDIREVEAEVSRPRAPTLRSAFSTSSARCSPCTAPSPRSSSRSRASSEASTSWSRTRCGPTSATSTTTCCVR
jgi:magnesium transporter